VSRWAVLCLFVAACGGNAAPERSSPTPRAHVVASAVPGATAVRACAGAGDYWPTMTVALAGGRAWVACKEESRVVGARTVALDGDPIALVADDASLWALDAAGTVYCLDPATGKVLSTVDTLANRPYNLWLGAGSLWTAADGTGEIVRIDDGKVSATIPVGDGPADMVFDGDAAWVVNHRDRALVRIDTRTNRAKRVRVLDAEVPERMVMLDGSLWITGRGTDLLQVDPRSGRVKQTIEIGASGIDVVAAGGALWVPSRSEAVEQSGLPTMESLRVAWPDGRTATLASPSGRVDVHGLVADSHDVWFADNTAGVLYRMPISASRDQGSR
jgi:outer membrane protein assembly factor BamB